MIIVDFKQGSQEWLEHRRTHFNASDAPKMMGVKSRNQLLYEMATGIEQEVDAATQARFDDGHRFEALARPLAEKLIGQELYPVTGVLGKFSASFDGITMDEKVCFEHKTINNKIRNAIVVHDLDVRYRIQMEQQLMVSGAERCLFMATIWDGDELKESRDFWYESNPELRAEIIASWAQFEKDLAAYVPVEIVEPPKANAIMALPALAIQIRGEVTLSNLPEFKRAAETFIANIKTDLNTDEDFANAEATVKFCKTAEETLELTKSAAIAQTASIDELMRTIDFIKAQLRDKRLALDKLVTTKKDSLKAKIVMEYQTLYREHIAALGKEIAPINLTGLSADFAGAIKNKRTLASLYEAADNTLAQSKIAADAIARDIRAKQAWLAESAAGHEFLFSDLQQVIYKPMDDFQILVNSRIEKHVAATKLKIEAEIAAAKAREEAEIAAAKAKEEAAKAAEIAAAKATETARNNDFIGCDEILPGEEIFVVSFPKEEAAKDDQGLPGRNQNYLEHIKPSNQAIFECVAREFGVTITTAIAWLSEIDFKSEKVA